MAKLTCPKPNEPGLSLAKAARLPALKIDGKGPSPSTLYRWAQRGWLEVWKLGNRLVTSEAAVIRSNARRNGWDGGGAAGGGGGVQSAAMAAAERELDAAGVR